MFDVRVIPLPPSGRSSADAPAAAPVHESTSASHASPERRFRRMVDEHFDFVWRLLRSRGLSPTAADDAAQHVFVVASTKVAEIKEGSEQAFLFGTAVGVAANVRRSQSTKREVADETAVDNAVDCALNPEQETVRRERCRIVEEILASMPEELSTVFVLFELEGLTSIEIAAMLAIPVGTASSRLRRAREHFEACVKRKSARNGGLS